MSKRRGGLSTLLTRPRPVGLRAVDTPAADGGSTLPSTMAVLRSCSQLVSLRYGPASAIACR
jgi:hypothetical protein